MSDHDQHLMTVDDEHGSQFEDSSDFELPFENPNGDHRIMLDNMGVYKRNEIAYRRKLRDNDWTRTSYWGGPYKTFEALTKLLISFLGCVFILFGIPMQLRSITHARHKTSQLFLKICLLMFSFSFASFVSLIIIMLARSFLDLSAYHTGCLTTFSHFAKHWRGVYVEVTPSDLGYVGPFGVEVVASFGTGATRGFFERDVVVLQRTTFCQTFVQRIRLCQLEDASFKQLVIPAGRDCIFCATENQVRSIGCLSCTYIFLRRKTKQQTSQTWWVN